MVRIVAHKLLFQIYACMYANITNVYKDVHFFNDHQKPPTLERKSCLYFGRKKSLKGKISD